MSTLIFDFDGTLGNTYDIAVDIVYRLTGMAPLPPERIMRLRQLPLLKAVREAGIPLRHVPRLLLDGRQHMHERMAEVPVFEGMPAVLHQLKEQGHELYIMSSNSEQNIRLFLDTHQLTAYFTSVEGGVGILNKAAALRKTMRHNHLQVRDCYYIGDEVRDVHAAHKVGARMVAVSWGYQAREALEALRPYALIDTPAELIAVCNPSEAI